MAKIVVSNDLRDKLNSVRSEVRLCDETGSTVGWFLPEAEYMKVRSERARRKFDDQELNTLGFSDEELAAAEKQPGGYTTAEVLAHLKYLGSGGSKGQNDDKRID
jgi:hypothetical protein